MRNGVRPAQFSLDVGEAVAARIKSFVVRAMQ
jgi:hypothetical protein